MVISYRSLPQRLLKAHDKTTRNYEWLQEHWEEIQADYSDKFIVVADREVVYNTEVYTDLLVFLSQNRDQSDIIAVRVRPQDHVVIL